MSQDNIVMFFTLWGSRRYRLSSVACRAEARRRRIKAAAKSAIAEFLQEIICVKS